MKTIITSILILSSIFSWSQHQILDTDTTLDYKTRFYKNGVLALNGYYVYAIDSASYFSIDTLKYYDFTTDHYDLDSSKMYRLEHGKWISHYIRNKHKFYSLGEYNGGMLKGKKYDFRENGTLYSTFKRYPKIGNYTFHGSQLIYYDKKGVCITKIEYILFNEDQTDSLYWNIHEYSKDGKLTNYSYYDEKKDLHQFIDYNKKGEIILEFVRNPKEWYRKEWNAGRTKMKTSERINGQLIKRTYRKGKLVRENIKLIS